MFARVGLDTMGTVRPFARVQGWPAEAVEHTNQTIEHFTNHTVANDRMTLILEVNGRNVTDPHSPKDARKIEKSTV